MFMLVCMYSQLSQRMTCLGPRHFCLSQRELNEGINKGSEHSRCLIYRLVGGLIEVCIKRESTVPFQSLFLFIHVAVCLCVN